MSFIPLQPAHPTFTPRRGALTWSGALLIALAALLLAIPFDGPAPRVAALALFLAICGIVNLTLVHHRHDRFGLANGITLSRAAGAATLAALAVDPDVLASARAAWLATAGSAILLLADGLDGWAARSRAMTSDFGERFDMEVDAVTILALSTLVFALGKAGGWIVAAGLLRYAFLLAGHIWPKLARPLAPSFRRKAVCAFQILALTVLLAPVVTPPHATILAAAALAALVWSFGLDIARLIRQ